MPNFFQPVGAGSSLDQAIAVFNNNFAKLDNEAFTKVFRGAGGINAFTLGHIKDVGIGLMLRDPDNIPRIICYIDADGTPILKVSKDGFDVITTGDQNLIFNSSQNAFKIVLEGEVTVSRSAGTTSGTATVSYLDFFNEFGAVPAWVAYSSGTPLPIIDVDSSGATAGLINSKLSATINTFTKEITFRLTAPDYVGNTVRTFGQNAIIKYYLFQETAS